MARVCPLSAIDHLIVDSNVSADQRRMLEEHEIRVTVVPIPETQ
jgi:DeoR/GlpR family transcriptional regulator of sugar metabolism